MVRLPPDDPAHAPPAARRAGRLARRRGAGPAPAAPGRERGLHRRPLEAPLAGGARLTRGLTWGDEVSGEPAVEIAERYGVFGSDHAVLEVGPGYGRILGAALARGVEFRRYIGLDLSQENVDHLRRTYDDPRLELVCGDVESADFDEPLDAAYSFLTFKHIYPSFAAALANIGRQLRPGGRVVFDLIEGSREYFHRDQVTFMREYTRPEAAGIVARAGLRLVAVDEVVHAPGRARMLIVAERPPPQS